MGDPNSLMCLDWLLASTEYVEFVCMMLEFKVTHSLFLLILTIHFIFLRLLALDIWW
jgi:hypothetical protein